MSRVLMNDARVAERVQADFVPVSGGIERWQPDRYGWPKSASSDWFLRMAKNAYKGDAFLEAWFQGMGTYQGMYVAGADGTPYRYTNCLVYGDLTPEKFLQFLDEALNEFKKRPPKKVEISQNAVDAAAPAPPDASVSVVRVYCRDRLGAQPGSPFIGQDMMWIYADEVREILKASRVAAAAVPLPRPIVARFVRFQLLDHVGNVGQAFSENDVKQADFSCQRIRQSDTISQYRFTGAYSSERVGSDGEEKGRKYGVEGTIEGAFDVDVAAARITRFRAYGESTAWGHHGREGKWPLVFAFIEENDHLALTVPPVWHGISPVWVPLYRNPSLAIWKDKKP